MLRRFVTPPAAWRDVARITGACCAARACPLPVPFWYHQRYPGAQQTGKDAWEQARGRHEILFWCAVAFLRRRDSKETSVMCLRMRHLLCPVCTDAGHYELFRGGTALRRQRR